MKTKACATRPKGVQGDPKRLSSKAISRQPVRCQSAGGASGKSNNAGRAPRWEQFGKFTSPGKRRPHSVPAVTI